MKNLEKESNFCFIYWNIWVEPQFNEKLRDALLKRISELIVAYQPDVFGVSEIMRSGKWSPIIELIEEKGYKVHYTHFYVWPDGLHEFGTITASRVPIKVKEYKLSPYKLSRYLCVATINLTPSLTFDVGVIHPLPLGSRGWREHMLQMKTFEQYIADKSPQAKMVIGGDLNEVSWITNLRRNKLPLNRQTGSLLRPTWTLGGRRNTPIRANLDSILWTKQESIVLKEFAVLDKYPSDHAPLLGRFYIK